jgi:biotin carboxylase
VHTNLALHAELLADAAFAAGGVDTHWLGQRLAPPGNS